MASRILRPPPNPVKQIHPLARPITAETAETAEGIDSVLDFVLSSFVLV